MKRPNSMNRYGLVLNDKLALHNMVSTLVSSYAGPLASSLFPTHIGIHDSDDFHAFTVRYKGGEDVALKLHVDSSVGTMNVNLNSPDQ